MKTTELAPLSRGLRNGRRRHWRCRRLRLRRLLGRLSWRLLPALALLVLLYGLSPYLTLWRLERAVAGGPDEALARLVDIDAVREEIRRRLNKDTESRIGEVSDPFIAWMQQIIRAAGRDDIRHALEGHVTLAWLRELLQRRSPPAGLLEALGQARFDAPTGFRVRLNSRDGAPVRLHLRFDPGALAWRVTAVYY